MNHHYPETVQKIVNDYLGRVKQYLRGMPEKDRDESVREIESHIFESYSNDATPDEVNRILNVLGKLGEPSRVFADKMPGNVVNMGKKRNLPLYILAGVLIGLFGLPIGVGGIGVLFGLIGAVLALTLAYFVTAGSFIIAGLAGMVVSIIRIVDPVYLDQVAEFINIEVANTLYFSSPVAEGILGLFASMMLGAVGVLLLIFGRYIFRGISFLFNMTVEKIKDFRRKRKPVAA